MVNNKNSCSWVVPGMGIVNGVSSNYEDLNNKPTLNGVPIQGNLTSANLGIVNDKKLTYTQRTAAQTWTINHNLGKYPSVSIVDSGKNVVVGEVKYIDMNTIEITFTGEFSGQAYLN